MPRRSAPPAMEGGGMAARISTHHAQPLRERPRSGATPGDAAGGSGVVFGPYLRGSSESERGAEKSSRRLMGYKQMPELLAALDAQAPSQQLDMRKKAA